MSDTLKISGLCLISVILLIVLKKYSAEMSTVLKIAVVITLFGACAMTLSPVINYLSYVFETTKIGKYGEILIKCLCISLISGVCATLCRDSGEESISQFALLAGRIQIIILSLPLIEEILDSAIKLLDFI